MIQRYLQGTTIRLKTTVKDDAGNLYTPDGGVTVQVLDKDGVEILAATSMTAESTGVYYYDWQTNSGDTAGICSQVSTSLDGGKSSIKKDDCAFEIYT